MPYDYSDAPPPQFEVIPHGTTATFVVLNDLGPVGWLYFIFFLQLIIREESFAVTCAVGNERPAHIGVEGDGDATQGNGCVVV